MDPWFPAFLATAVLTFMADIAFVAVAVFAVRRTRTAASGMLVLAGVTALIAALAAPITQAAGGYSGAEAQQVLVWVWTIRLVEILGRLSYAIGLWWLIVRVVKLPMAGAASSASPGEGPKRTEAERP